MFLIFKYLLKAAPPDTKILATSQSLVNNRPLQLYSVQSDKRIVNLDWRLGVSNHFSFSPLELSRLICTLHGILSWISSHSLFRPTPECPICYHFRGKFLCKHVAKLVQVSKITKSRTF